MESTTFSVHSTRDKVGRRPVLLLLPGMVCNHRIWTAQIEGLADLVEPWVMAYDPAPSMTEMARCVLDQAPATFFLAGHSMGARVAMEVTRLVPERVRALCLIATEHRAAPSGQQGRTESAARMKLLETAKHHGMQRMAEDWLPQLVAGNNQVLAAVIIGMLVEHTPEQLAAHIAAGMTRQDASDLLSGLKIPVLLIAGSEDMIRPLQGHEEMMRLLRDGELKVIAQCGHMPTLEQPEQVNAAMRRWIVNSLMQTQA